MNPRKIIEFFKKPTGQIIGFILVVFLALGVIYFFGEGARDSQNQSEEEQQIQSRIGSPGENFSGTTTVERQTPRGYDVVPTPTPLPQDPVVAGDVPTTRPAIDQNRAPLSVYSGQPPPASTPAPAGSGQTEPSPISGDSRYAPFGRLVKCVLVNTVDSVNTTTPLIGIVMEDLWWNGRVVIPANTEVHGIAAPNPVQQRIASQGRFRFILAPNDVNPKGGEELVVEGIALDRDESDAQDESGNWKPRFGITDASAGLKGRVIKSDEWAEIKLFAAELISGAAGGFAQTTTTIFGNVPVGGNAANAGIGAANSVLDRYAEQILNTIERDGFYVQVPAGKQFYLYVMQPLDLRYANFAPAPDPEARNAAGNAGIDDPYLNQLLSNLQANRQRTIQLQQQMNQRQQQTQATDAQRQLETQQQNAAVQQEIEQLLLRQQQGGAVAPPPTGLQPTP